MRRRDISTLLFAGAAAASAVMAATSPGDPAAAGSQTEAEKRAGVNPSRTEFPEADVRRYGASTDAADNSAAFNAALLVSANGGNAAFVPPGRFKTARPLNAVHDSSMHGTGTSSVIAPQECDGLVFGSAGDYTTNGLSRFFRDFQIIGGNPEKSTYRAVVVDFASRSKGRVVGVLFENLYVANFALGAYLRGLWFASFVSCNFYRCHRGISFVGESVANCILNCHFNWGGMHGTGDSWGISFESADGESTQSTRIISTHVYCYDILVNVVLALELQIEHCDLSAAQSVAVQINSTMGGFWLRDCWIETDKAAATTGVNVASVQPNPHVGLHIVGNYLTCDLPFKGSRGIDVGSGNAGIIVNENTVFGFDQAITLGASPHSVCKHNRVSCVTEVYGAQSHAVLVDAGASGADVGPNEILPGKLQSARMSAGKPEIRVADVHALPVGTPVQFDADANGFLQDVTYFVIGATRDSITVGPTATGRPMTAAGGSPVNLCPSPEPLALISETPRGLSFFGNGAFIASAAGSDAAAGTAINWSASGKLVALTAGETGSPAASIDLATLRAAAIPAFLRPAPTRAQHPGLRGAGTETLIYPYG